MCFVVLSRMLRPHQDKQNKKKKQTEREETSETPRIEISVLERGKYDRKVQRNGRYDGEKKNKHNVCPGNKMERS